MRRIYFLVPDVDTARKVVDELLLARIDERHIHAVARRGTPLEDLPKAGFLQQTDFIPAIQQGLAVGGATGMLAGLVAMALPGGPVVGGGALLGLSLLGGGLGAWWSSMIGASVGNRQLKDHETAIERGEILLMIDIPKARLSDIEQRIKAHHPTADFKGMDLNIPPFP